MKNKGICSSDNNQQTNIRWLIDFLDQMPVMIFSCLFDSNLTVTYVSRGCSDLTGYNQEMIMHNRDVSLKDIIAQEYHDSLHRCLNESMINRKEMHCEFEIITKAEKRKNILAFIKPVDDKKYGDDFVGFLHDITERKQIEKENEYLSTHDFLSGLYNRRYFSAALFHQEREKSYPLSCLIANINGLNLINNVYGYDIGDNLIKEAGKLLSRYIENGMIGACIGGDEFILVAPFTSKEKIKDIADEISQELEKYKDPSTPAEERLSMAIGYSTSCSAEDNIFKACGEAKTMMRYAKLLDNSSDVNGILRSLLATLFEKSGETEEHCERLAKLSVIIGTRLGLSENEIYILRLSAMLHDIGKIGIDDSILKKTGRLTEEERKIMKTHPEIGYRIAISWSSFKGIAPYILSHHERWDGTGYPHGLRGKEIPLLARILAVADAYDAMTSTRVYREPIGKQEAMAEIRRNASTQFDPTIAELFLTYLENNEP